MSLRQTAIDSADVCLKYYTLHPEDAIFKTGIRTLQPTLLRSEMVLTLDKRIRSVDNLSIRIGKDQRFSNDSEHHHFTITPSRKKEAILTEVSEELAAALETALEKGDACWFESDKTFLVKRVKKWYEDYGHRVHIPAVKPNTPVSYHPDILISDNQKRAVQTAMLSPFSYIWGAPGTGKTRHVLATCIYSCLMEGKKVLITAPTNTALDQSLSGILEALSGDETLSIRSRTLRLGTPEENIGMEFQDVCEEAVSARLIHEIGEQYEKKLKFVSQLTSVLSVKTGKAVGEDAFPEMTVSDIRSRISQLNRDLAEMKAARDKAAETGSCASLLKYIDIIAATVDTCIYRLQPDGFFHPDHIFLDEAGYCSVIKGMPFTAYDCPLTLLGDHMQLPPVCDVEPGKEDRIMEEEADKLFLWRFSSIAMEPVIEAKDYSSFKGKKDLTPTFHHLMSSSLVETHRFGPKLAGILADTVYDRSFISSGTRDTQIWVIDAPKLSADIGIDKKTGKRIRFSRREEETIIQLILNNIHSEIAGEIGILTPYREYRRQLKADIGEKLKQNHYNDLVQDNIMTIHQSQGSEWDAVVVSVVDTNDYFDSFMMNPKRNDQAIKIINTAVSRARQLLIIICDEKSWKQSPDQFITKIISIAEKHEATDPLPVKTEESKAESVPVTESKFFNTPSDIQKPIPLLQKDDMVLYGKYPQDGSGSKRPIRWKIIKTVENKALLFSEKCLDVQPFSEKHISSFWEKSSIRAWLNNRFYNEAFSSSERSSILETIVSNSSEQSDTSLSVMNGSPVKDHVFLLSFLEAKSLLPTEEARAAEPTEYALSMLPDERKKVENGKASPSYRWLLRSNSQNSFLVSVVDQAGQLGRRSSVKSRRMIRPAMWVDLPALSEKSANRCQICGAYGKGLICSGCMRGKSLDLFIARIAEKEADSASNNADREIRFLLIDEQLISPWKEYFRLISLSDGLFCQKR